jgi:hypothetical protein
MLTLNEARKLAGLPPIKESEDQATQIYDRLVKMADETDITDDDEKIIKSDIAGKLKQGWLPAEIMKFLNHMVYFNPKGDEDEGLKGMKRVEDAVKARLGKTNESLEEEVHIVEARSGWSHISDGSMVRFSGSTFPQVAFSNGKIWARNDNGMNPSKTVSTSDLTLNGLKALISSSITGTMPSDADLKKFLKTNKIETPVAK